MKTPVQGILVFLIAQYIAATAIAQATSILPSTIFGKIAIPAGWSSIVPNRPKTYAYKIKKDNGISSIAISHSKSHLLGFIDYASFSSGAELLEKSSKDLVEEYFEYYESNDERATVEAESIGTSTFGGLAALEIYSIYTLKENGKKAYINYYVIRGTEGWITIGLSGSTPKGEGDFPVMNAMVSAIDLTTAK